MLSDPASQWYLAGTVFHCLAKATMAPASRTPKPNKWLNSKPTPFIFQWNLPLESNREFLFDVKTVKCCMSRQVSLLLEWRNAFISSSLRLTRNKVAYLASKARANTPAASGAAADVPECVLVHLPYKSVVATPVLGSLAPLEKVEARVDEQLSS